ncbi:hypothetical protein T09_3898, partial [Trichinella sp. T9]
LRRLSQAECRDTRRRSTHPAHRRYARCAGGGQVVQHSGLSVRLLASRSRRRKPGEVSVLHTFGALPIPRHAVRAVQRPS